MIYLWKILYLIINEMPMNILYFQKFLGIPVQTYCLWLNVGALHPHWNVSFSLRSLAETNKATQDIRCFSEQWYQNNNTKPAT